MSNAEQQEGGQPGEAGKRPEEDALSSSAKSVIGRIGEIAGGRPQVVLRDESGMEGGPPEAPHADPVGGKYVVRDELGRGGVGAVYRGHDQDLGRDVAIKFLHEKYRGEPGLLHRFVEEAQIGGQLQHPGIVPVYDLGLIDEKPYFAMKLVKGETLAKKLRERGSCAEDQASFLSIFESICQTVAYAHARGVVHRDLKPANIMIGSFGEVQVVDWGMGKVLQAGSQGDTATPPVGQDPLSIIETVRSDGSAAASLVGSVMGTPGYMPPEQARGDVGAMDERSDVFALGAILCEILTGAPAYVGEFHTQLEMASLAKVDDAHCRLDACGADPDLIELAKRCLMPSPAVRPGTAEVLATAVHAYLAGVESRVQEARVEAAEANVRAQALKRTQVMSVCLIGVFAVGLSLSLWFWRSARVSAGREELAKVAALRSARDAEANEQLAQEQAEVAQRELARAVEIKSLIADMLAGVSPQVARGADVILLKAILNSAAARLSEGRVEDELVAAEMRMLIGEVYIALGLYPEAEQLLSLALEARERLLGTNAKAAVQTRRKLATAYQSLARLDEAEELFDQVLALRRDRYGEEDIRVLDSWTDLAGLYWDQGRSAEAEEIFRRVVDTVRRVLGPESTRVPLAMANLGLLLSADETRLAEARSLFAEALEQNERLLGPDHPITIWNREQIVMIVTDQGATEESLALQREVAEANLRILGPQHPTALTSKYRIGLLLAEMKRYEEALEVFLEAYQGWVKRLGDEHPMTMAARFNLGTTYRNLDRLAEAEPYHRRALEFRMQTLEPTDPEVIQSKFRLGRVVSEQGRHQEALPLLEDALVGLRGLFGGDDLRTLLCQDELAVAYRKVGRLEEAVALAQEALSVRLRDLEEGDPYTVWGLHFLSTVKEQQGQYSEAEGYLRQSLEIRIRIAGPHHADTRSIQRRLGNFFWRTGQFAEAADMFQGLIEGTSGEGFVPDEESAMDYLSLASLYAMVATASVEEDVRLRGVAYVQRALGDDGLVMARHQHLLGNFQWGRGNLLEAEPAFLRAIEIRRALLGVGHRDTLGAMTDLGSAYNKMQLFEAAAEQLEVSYPGLVEALGAQHPWTGNALEGLHGAYVGLGRDEAALELLPSLIEARISRAQAEDAGADLLFTTASYLLTVTPVSFRSHVQALAFAERALALEEGGTPLRRASILRVLALAQFEAGDGKSARSSLERARALAPEEGDPEIAQRLAEWEAAQGER